MLQKKILLLGLISCVFLTAGCGTGSDDVISELNTKLNESNIKIEELEKEVIRLSEENNKLQEINSTLESKTEEESVESNDTEDSTNNDVNNIEVTVKSLGYFENSEIVKAYKKNIEADGKVIINKIVNNEKIFVIETNEQIKDVRLHNLGEEFINSDFDMKKYLTEYRDLDYILLTETLSINDVVLFDAIEAEGMPVAAVSWVEPSGNVKHYIISYNGRGDDE